LHGLGKRGGALSVDYWHQPRVGAMHPYFFGPPERQLFAVHHPAQVAARGHGVVICYPWGHEYVNSLRGCRQLAARLARLGFDVLRFDYYGTGDSAGWGEDVTCRSCIDDVLQAIEELTSNHRLHTLSLIGVRLGATVAALAAAQRDDVEGLVMWEPVEAGRVYLAALRARHAAFLQSEAEGGRRQQPYTSAQEIMGFPLPPAMAAELDGVDLLSLTRSPAAHVLLLGGEPGETSAAQRTVAAHLGGLCSDFAYALLPGQGIWAREVGEERALVPNGILDAMLEWFSSRWARGDASAPTASLTNARNL
jgi:pimeloyl-ACP methyl ester carboxylesterase